MVSSNVSTSPGAGDRPRTVRWTSPAIVEWQRQQLRDSGQDPAIVPDEPFRFIALKELRLKLSLSPATIYRAMAAGKFPRPITLNHLTTRIA